MTSTTDNLINYIAEVYESTSGQIAPNIVRGHLRSISSDIENGIAKAISEILPQDEYKLFLDPSIHVNGKDGKLRLIRPDLLIVRKINGEYQVVALIEIKSNMGWCRDARGVIDGIIDDHFLFFSKRELTCEFSTQKEKPVKVIYEQGVRLYLLSLTGENCSDDKHKLNKLYAKGKGIMHFVLFSEWYDSLKAKDIDRFIKDLQSFPRSDTKDLVQI